MQNTQKQKKSMFRTDLRPALVACTVIGAVLLEGHELRAAAFKRIVLVHLLADVARHEPMQDVRRRVLERLARLVERLPLMW